MAATAPGPARTAVSPVGSITDVGGIRVGHHQRIGRGWQTGTTVVFAPDGATPGVSVRGGGPGTRETDALAPQNLVQRIHAVTLTGGSAYGLASADGVVAWLEEQGLGFPIGPPSEVVGVVPVVPAAVVFDLGRGGRFANRPDAAFGRRAIAAARQRPRTWGSIGAGTGARAGGLQGGVGTASATLTVVRPDGTEGQVVIGALAVVNANGSPVDPATGLPWEPDGFALRRPTRAERSAVIESLGGQAGPSLNTTIGVVATSAALTKTETTKLADVAHDGLARAIRPAHSMFDGDTVFGLATGEVELGDAPAAMRSSESRQRLLNQVLSAAADTFAAACTHAVIAASRVGDAPAYRDLCPSVG